MLWMLLDASIKLNYDRKQRHRVEGEWRWKLAHFSSSNIRKKAEEAAGAMKNSCQGCIGARGSQRAGFRIPAWDAIWDPEGESTTTSVEIESARLQVWNVLVWSASFFVASLISNCALSAASWWNDSLWFASVVLQVIRTTNDDVQLSNNDTTDTVNCL